MQLLSDIFGVAMPVPTCILVLQQTYLLGVSFDLAIFIGQPAGSHGCETSSFPYESACLVTEKHLILSL